MRLTATHMLVSRESSVESKLHLIHNQHPGIQQLDLKVLSGEVLLTGPDVSEEVARKGDVVYFLGNPTLLRMKWGDANCYLITSQIVIGRDEREGEAVDAAP